MEARGSNAWAFVLGALIIAAAIALACMRPAPKKDGLQTGSFAELGAGGGTSNALIQPIVAKNVPVVTAFLGDLEAGGYKQQDETVIPFVIGEILNLDADATNAVEYRWTVDGQVLKDKDQEWSKAKAREYEIKTAGEHRFTVQVRGADGNLYSQIKEKTITTIPLHIESFERSAAETDDDRRLTAEDFTVEVSMTEPISPDVEYRYRYFVNDEIVKNPEDNEEWSSESTLTYVFPAPGQYTFKVEVRRSTAKEAEASAQMADSVTVADAVLLSFDTTPEKYAPLGATVHMDVFPTSIAGTSECRFGVKRVTAADFEWLPEENGTIWGDDSRQWTPTAPGNYLLRAEVREVGKANCDDFREILYTVTEGGF